MSPFSGFGSTAALAFVLIVAAIKAVFEDKKRHQEDHRTNNSIAHVVQADGKAAEQHHLHLLTLCNSRCRSRCIPSAVAMTTHAASCLSCFAGQ